MNIIYLNPDELRADVLGCYGHPPRKDVRTSIALPRAAVIS